MVDSTESSIVVQAGPAAVLAVIADFEAYPAWASEVREAAVLTRDAQDRPLTVRFTLDAGALKDTYTLQYVWATTGDGAGELSWSLVEAGLLKALNGSYRLTPEGSGTRVVYRLSVDLHIPMLGLLRRRAEKVITDTALTELKKRVES